MRSSPSPSPIPRSSAAGSGSTAPAAGITPPTSAATTSRRSRSARLRPGRPCSSAGRPGGATRAASARPAASRPIYIRLRAAARHACDAAWSQPLAHPPAAADGLATYRAHLLATGCAQDPASRRLDARHWGTDAQTIDLHLLAKHVAAGQILGWAGDTGPGGKRGPGSPNTHLHVFFARRDPTDQSWYLFDPYGIYGLPPCYPLHLTDPVVGPCVRYPVAWAGGRPRFP